MEAPPYVHASSVHGNESGASRNHFTRSVKNRGTTERDGIYMKKITAVIFAILMLAGLFSCSDSRVPDGYQLASSDNEAFYLYVPQGWTSNVSGGTASAFYTSSDTSNVSMTSIMNEEGFRTLDDYAAAVEKSLGEILPSYEKAADFSDTTLAGQAARSFDYTCTLGGVNYRYRQIFCTYKGYFYVFTYTAKAENFERHLDDVEGILGVLQFK